MATFSGSEALGAGFSLVKREPLAVAAWGLVYFVALLVPPLALYSVMLPSYLEMLTGLGAGGEVLKPDAVFSQMMQYNLASWGINFLSAAMISVLACAVFRAVLHPEQRAFAYLRVGPAEGWIFLLYLVQAIILSIATVFAIVVVAVAATAGYAAGGGGERSALVAAAVGIPSGVLALGLLIWVCLRLSMAWPMTFESRSFQLFESWAVTKGLSFKLFLLVLALGATMVALQLGCLVVIGVPVGLLFASSFDASWWTSLFQKPPSVWIATLAPWAFGGGLVLSLLAAMMMTISTAPWANVYRQIRQAPN